jgi:hypothetical protein
MGWSCRADAHETMQKWTAACVAQTGSQNEFDADGVRYFWELSRTEHDDGAITGTIMRVTEKRPDGSMMAVKCGSFRINPDGTIGRAPAFLRSAS